MLCGFVFFGTNYGAARISTDVSKNDVVDLILFLIPTDGAHTRSSKRPIALPMLDPSTSFRDTIHEQKSVSRTC